jgi:hypothetical protein
MNPIYEREKSIFLFSFYEENTLMHIDSYVFLQMRQKDNFFNQTHRMISEIPNQDKLFQ